MKNNKLISLLVAMFLIACTGDQGAEGPEGPAGPAGPEGPIGPGFEPTDAPEGLTVTVWSPAVIEDRRQSPPAIQGSLSIVRDDLNQYFIAFDEGFTLPSDGTFDVYQAVAGAELTTQMMDNDPTEQPKMIATISQSGAQFIRLDSAPEQATGGNQRFFDWVIIHDGTQNISVADADAVNDIPDGIPALLWNSFELEDRRTNPATVGFGSAALVRDERDTYFIMLNERFVRPDNAPADVFSAVAGAQLDQQIANNDPTERPFQIGRIENDGLQFIRLEQAPPLAAGGNQRFFDWIILHNGTENVAVADFDARNDEPQNQ